MTLTQQVARKARDLGADLVGVAPLERFAGAPARMSPEGLMPGATCVVVAAIHHPDACVELGGEPTPQDVGSYAVQYWMNARLDDISFLLGRFLEDRGHRALPIAASNIWRYYGYKDLRVAFAPDLAHRYAAVAAGLGEIGWNNLALTPEFGPRNRFVSVVTDAPLEATPMYDGPPLCDQCMACVEHCPMDTFCKETRGTTAIEIGGRRFEFPDTNKWRCAWAENFDLSLHIDPPEQVDEQAILDHLERYGQRGGAMGSCLKYCMVPALRVSDPDYCSAPRRRKTPTETSPERLLARVEQALADSLFDVMAVGRANDFPDGGPVHPRLHLPDAASVISIGVRVPPGGESNDEIKATLRRKLRYAAMDAARQLDLCGYSAVAMTHIPDALVAEQFCVFDPDMEFTTVLSSAPLPAATRRGPGRADAPTPNELREFCHDAGADLVGFCDADRYAAFQQAFGDARIATRGTETVQDHGLGYGPFVPSVARQESRLLGLEDWLPGARGVIVLGLHFPDAALDTAKTTPAETVGPYVFACYESLRLLEDIAYRVIKRLNRTGHRAVPAADLAGQASRVVSPRGMLPDMRSNRFAAALAGLATIGVNGCPLTPEYGVRQRFVAVVTDLRLPGDMLLDTPAPCADCDRPCVEACPTAALGDTASPLEIEGVTFNVPAVDGFACDWAKRLALSGAEGPDCCGLDVDVPVPARRTAAAVASAVAGVHWGVQKHLITIGEECIRVCPARGRVDREHRTGNGGLCNG